MLPGAGSAMIRVAAVVPVVLLVLFTGLLRLLGLMCGCERRRYVTDLSRQAMDVIGVLLPGGLPATYSAPHHRHMERDADDVCDRLEKES